MIGIITESASCATETDCQRYKISIVDDYCVIDGKEYKDREAYGIEITDGAYTKVPTEIDFYNSMVNLSQETGEILCIVSSKRFNFAYDNAEKAKKLMLRTVPACRVEIIEVAGAVGALLMFCVMARELEISGVGFTDIVNILNSRRKALIAGFSVDEPEILGRRKRVLKKAGDGRGVILSERPLYVFDELGNIIVRSMFKNRDAELEYVRENRQDISRLVICYTEKDMHLYNVVSEAEKLYPEIVLFRREAAPSVKIVFGRGYIGLFGFGK